MIPIFEEFDTSLRCHSNCEFAIYDSECNCKDCGGRNHGRCSFPSYMDRQNGFLKTMYSNGEERHWYQKGPLVWFYPEAA